MKKGITVVTISIIVVIIIILLGTITVGSYNSIQNGKKLTFALEISSIQEEVDRYEGDSADDYPITGIEYVVDLKNISTESIDQFDDEKKDGNNIKLYEIDLSLLGIDDTKFGNNQTDKDMYLLSLDTGRVYYLEGLTYREKTYYTLTQDLIDIKEKNEKVKDEESSNEPKPIITTKAFVVKTNEANLEREIYLTDIKVEGEEIKTVKYDKTIIKEQDAKEYFKNNGTTLNSDRVKVNPGEYITIYAETKSGKYSIRLEGIPTIPNNFYYVGGTIPTGVVISDNPKDANKGTSINGDVTSLNLLGNQFVWVPVFAQDSTFKGIFKLKDGYYGENIQDLVSSGKSSEPFSQGALSAENDLTGEFAEYNKMTESVEKYKGFYVGRYEAGTSAARMDVSNGTTDVLVQKGKSVYNYVAWGPSMTSVSGDIIWASKNQGKGAVELSRDMYITESYVGSTLIYGVQWDAIMDFVADVDNPNKEGKKYIQDSSGMGFYSISTPALTAPALTGSNEDYKVRNIYDLAGNVFEWTMEAHLSDYRVFRGGGFGNEGSMFAASSRSCPKPETPASGCGFRVALYVRNM